MNFLILSFDIFCFKIYKDPNSAISALNGMKGFELAGRQLKIGRPHNEPITRKRSSSLPFFLPTQIIPVNYHWICTCINPLL